MNSINNIFSKGNTTPETGGSSSSSLQTNEKKLQNRKEYFPSALKQSHPLMSNGIAKIYNAFPNAFGNLNQMTQYLEEVKKMGFNVVWINPIQKVGGKMFEKSSNQSGISYHVQGSAYATKNFDEIDERYIDTSDIRDGETIQAAGKRQLKAFTDKAKRLGLVPIFDLVLNHVAMDNEDIPPESLSQKSSIFMDVKQFDYSSPEKSKEILETHWKPYVRRYIEEYGFMGVRVDNVASMRFEGTHIIRRELYAYIHSLVDFPIIFDELLFSREDMDETIQKLILSNGSNPTHVTGSLFYASVGNSSRKTGKSIEARGSDLSHEMGMKSKMIFEHKGENGDLSVNPNAFGGVVNFTGNHDVYSLGYGVAMDMREQYFFSGNFASETEKTIGHIYRNIQKILDSDAGEKDKSTLENTKKKIMYFCHKNNIPPLNPLEYRKNVREKIALQAFVSSGGFYLLAGDETTDMSEKSVFAKIGYASKKEKSVLRPGEGIERMPDGKYNAFIESLLKYDEGYEKVKKLEEEKEKKEGKEFSRATNAIHNAKEEIRNKLKKILPNTPSQSSEFNFGQGPLIGKEGLRPFLQEVNSILSHLPKTEFGMFSKIVYLEEKPDLLVIIRTNGPEFKKGEARADLVVVNLDSEKEVDLNTEDMHKIYMGFETQVGESFDGSYDHARNAHLHLVGSINNKTEKQTESQSTSIGNSISR